MTARSSKYDEASLQRMLFRRQFLLCPSGVDCFRAWSRIDLRGDMTLRAHPDLGVEHATRGDKSISLLGYALDPLHPEASNLDILGGLLDRLDTCKGLLEATDRLGGRWILLVDDGRQSILFTDAAGMRQAFYVRNAEGQAWCASQPGLLAEVLTLPLDPDAVAFMQTDRYAHDENASTWFPGDFTPYQETKALLPNHYLDLRSGRPLRYWPRSNLEAIPFDEGVTKCHETIQGLMDAARRRFKMSVAMTAGWDSRLVLAATRWMADDVFYFTGMLRNMSAHHPDAAAPSRLLSRLGLKNNIVPCGGKADEAFAELFKRNVVSAHEGYVSLAEGMLNHCPPDRICVKGDVAEIVKCYWRLERSAQPTTPLELATLAEMESHPFVIQAFAEWLGNARPRNVHLLDLFCWEQAMGRQEATVEAECDLVQEAFSPLNCRNLLTTMLCVDEKHRRPPTFRLFRALIERMWPETLLEPINGQAQIGAKAAVRAAIMRTGLQQLLPGSLKRLGKQWLS